MPHGRHVSREECAEMRRMREETSYTLETIGHMMADEDGPYHLSTVEWHVNGRCTHPTDE